MQQSLLIMTVFSFSAAIFGIWWIFRKSSKRKEPTTWKAVGKVTGLCIYPIKGGYRMELPKIICTEYGPKMFDERAYQIYDRNFIIYKEKNKEYATPDVYPKISLIRVEPRNKNEFTLKAPDASKVTVKIPRPNEEKEEVRVYNDAKIIMLDCGNTAAKWLSRYIFETDTGLRLGFHDASQRRNIHENAYLQKYCDIYPFLSNEGTGMYSYLSSYSLINQTSVNEMNKRIGNENENVSAFNFRGNIMIESFDGVSYVEDTWKWVKIGNVVFYVIKPNTRCSRTNMNPDTSARSKDFEPMATLKKYRKLKDLKNIDFEGGDPVMGCYMGLHEGSTLSISIDDTVYVGE